MERILQVIGRMDRGGAETLIMNLYRNVDRSTIQFDFLVHTQEKADYDEEIESLGGKIYRLPCFSGLNYFTYKRACRKHFLAHPEHRIIHGHIGSTAAIYLNEAKKNGRFTIAHSHSKNYNEGIKKFIFSFLSYPTRNIADFFIGCSEQAGIDRFGKTVVQGDSFVVLRNGVEVDKFTCTEEQHRHEKMLFGYDGFPVFGHVGRFVEVKNHMFLIDVFKEIKKNLPQAKLLLIGRGPLEESVKEYVKKSSLVDDVIFLGLCDDVPTFLKILDIFVFPSISEGLPVSIIEAQAAGLPLITSSGVDKDACLLPTSKRISLDEGCKVWASELTSMYSELEERKDVADIIRNKGFDIKSSTNQLLSIYREGLEKVKKQ